MRVAIADSQSQPRALLVDTLQRAGYSCHAYKDVSTLSRNLNRDSFDLLIISWRNDQGSVFTEILRLRERAPPEVPILFVANQRSEALLVDAFSAGAADCMLDVRWSNELLARSRALLHRCVKTYRDQLKFGDYNFNEILHSISFDEYNIEMTRKEYDLANFLFCNLGRTLSRAHLYEAVWKDRTSSNSRALDAHVSRIRIKLRLTGKHGFRLLSVYGVGYRLDSTEKMSIVDF